MSRKRVAAEAGASAAPAAKTKRGGHRTRKELGQPDVFQLASPAPVIPVPMAAGAEQRAIAWVQLRAGLSANLQRALWDVTKTQARAWLGGHDAIVKGLTGFLRDELKMVVAEYVERKVLTCSVSNFDEKADKHTPDLFKILTVCRQVGMLADVRDKVLVPWNEGLKSGKKTGATTAIVEGFIADTRPPQAELFWCAACNILAAAQPEASVKPHAAMAAVYQAVRVCPDGFIMMDLRTQQRNALASMLKVAASAGASTSQRVSIAALDSRRSNRDKKALTDRTSADLRAIGHAVQAGTAMPYTKPAATGRAAAIGRREDALDRYGVTADLDIAPDLLRDGQFINWFSRLCSCSSLPLGSCGELRAAILRQAREQAPDNLRFKACFSSLLADLKIRLPTRAPRTEGQRAIFSRKSDEASTDETYLRGQLGELDASSDDVMVFELGFSRRSGL
eukprot:COSAG02_NODE_1938_length_10312_cov_16.495741_10_plen_451_part_00